MVSVVFAPGTGNERVLDGSDIYSLNPVRSHTGKSDASVSVIADATLDQYAQRQDRVHIRAGGGVVFTGFVVSSSRDPKTGQGRMRFDGVEKRLEETRPDYDSIGGSLQYSQTSLEDALRDYWPRTPFQNFSVTDQSTEQVATNQEVESAATASEWSTLASPADTDPVEVRNDRLELLQTNWIQEAESFATPVGSTASNAGEMSGGEYVIFTDSADSGGTLSFTTEHDIPEGELEIWYRNAGGSSGSGPGEVDWYLDGQSIGFTNDTLSLGWNEVFASNNATSPALSAGSHTVSLNAGSDQAWEGNRQIDLVAPLDGRYSYTLDNDNGGSGGYLDGPELYPQGYQFEFPDNQVSFNISAGDVTSTWNDTSNGQAIELSNDGGQTWTTTNNSSTASVSFGSAGRTAKARVTFSRYGSRTTATPQTGFNGQWIDDYQFTIDGDNLVVIDELELSSNHLSNILKLCNYGDFQYVVEHQSGSVSDMPVHCFQRGDETRSSPSGYSDPVSESREVASKSYYNSIYVQGAQDDSGNRPTAEVSDQDAINEAGREISPGVLRDLTITTEAGALFRARSLLDTALSENDLVGSKTIGPVVVLPGFSYMVDFGGGAELKTLEEVSLNLSPDSAQSTHRFSLPYELADTISGLKRETLDLSSRV